MASARQISATQSLSGYALTLTLTAAPTASELVEVFTSVATGPTTAFWSQATSSIVDSKGGSWSRSSPHAIIGNTGDSTGSPVSGTALAVNLCESGVRISGTALAVGDTITITFLSSGGRPIPTVAVGVVVGFSNIIDHFAFDDYCSSPTSPGAAYSNGDSWPTLGVSSSSLNWNTDLGSSGPPLPLEACCGFTAQTKYGGGGTLAPVNGSTIASASSGSLSLAVSFQASVSLAGRWEPGGTWSSAGSVLIANYRLAEVGCPPSILWFYVNGQWRQQNVDTEYALWVYRNGEWVQDCTELKGHLAGTWQN